MIAMSRGFGLWAIASFIAATGVGTLAWKADEHGRLVFCKTGRNVNPMMATVDKPVLFSSRQGRVRPPFPSFDAKLPKPNADLPDVGDESRAVSAPATFGAGSRQ